MTGGLIQLVAYGAQDLFLSGHSQVTFFRLVYRRHTNFSQETIEQNFNGSPGFGKKVIATLSRNGDLVHKIWLMIKVPSVTVKAGKEFRWLNWLGHVMVKWIEFEIGGQLIDKVYGEWLQIFAELTLKPGHQSGYADMIGNTPKLAGLTVNPSSNTTDVVLPGETLYVPLQFYFCRNPGLCIPLVALQYHEVRIIVEFRPLEECCYFAETGGAEEPPSSAVDSSGFNASLLVDYIFLDTDERRRFAQTSMESLITQVQFTGDESVQSDKPKIKLSFNHPTKELVWVCVKNSHTASVAENGPKFGKQPFNFTTEEDTTWLTGIPNPANGGGMGYQGGSMRSYLESQAIGAGGSNLYSPFLGIGASNPNFVMDKGINPVVKGKLQLNGHDRFAERDGRWFNLCVPYATHENIPSTGVNVYSFALRPEEFQPSGSLNMSRVDQVQLHLDLAKSALENAGTAVGTRIKIFAVSYNVLRVLSGMGGLAFSS